MLIQQFSYRHFKFLIIGMSGRKPIFTYESWPFLGESVWGLRAYILSQHQNIAIILLGSSILFSVKCTWNIYDGISFRRVKYDLVGHSRSLESKVKCMMRYDRNQASLNTLFEILVKHSSLNGSSIKSMSGGNRICNFKSFLGKSRITKVRLFLSLVAYILNRMPTKN